MGKFHVVTLLEMSSDLTNGSVTGWGVNTTWDTKYHQEVLSFGAKILYTSIICPMIAICIVGNALTMISYYTDPKLRTVQNLYLVNLAVADFFIGLISMPFYFVTTLLDYQWIFGRVFCKIWNSADFLVCLESAYAVVLISVDRSLMVWLGAAYSVRQTKAIAIVRIVVSWCLSFVIYVPAVLFWDVWVGYSILPDGVCDLEFYNNVPYTLTTSVLEFAVPFVSIVTLSIYLYITIMRKSRLAVNARVWSNSSARSQASFHTICVELDGKEKVTSQKKEDGESTLSSLKRRLTGSKKREPDDIEKRVLRRNQKAARRLAVLVGVFFLCWTPYTVGTIIVSACEGCIGDHLYEAMIWLQWANSMFNPFLYALTTPRFRQNYIRLLHLGKKKRQKRNHVDAPEGVRTSVSSC